MSCCGKTPGSDTNKLINAQLKEEKKLFDTKIKLLLLGTGESGKSTFFKQMKILHQNGYSDKERESFRRGVFSNIVTNMVSLLEAAQKLDIQILPENKESAQRVFQLDASRQDIEEIKIADILPDMKKLWADPGIQTCYGRANEFQLNDSAEYFFTNIDRISGKGYVPTEEDILRIRVKTSGVTEFEVKIASERFKFVDVGGQRSERRKWIYCFEDVTAIIFFAAINEFDQKLAEEETTNRMSEALKLFKDITNYPCFSESDTTIVLFLNKFDLFKKKLKKVNLNVYFKEYKGNNEANEAAEYIKSKFLELAPSNKVNDIYVHPTIATDTENISKIFSAVRERIVKLYLKSFGYV